MPVALTKKSIDLGIVTTNAEPMLKFYRDTLGFQYLREMKMPGGGLMHQLMCGESMIKIVAAAKTPPKPAAGGIQGAQGYRYWTISVSNIPELLSACEAQGYKIAVKETELRPGVRIAIVEDPDGNWVEFLSVAS
jgi:catechol 2,3-dioxygenase-like lactoylglutathione lyase family enzyme